MQQERKEISGKANTIAGFSIPLYLGILALVVVCMYMDCLPAGLVGGMIALMVLGEGLNFFRKSYTGCENVPGRLGHLYSGGGGHPGAGADSGADA
ncbi:MAG: hypothetical protein ACLTR6_04645 [Clostridium fessum]